jgi:hypothetical protein
MSSAGLQSTFRALTPLVLLGVVIAVVFEPFLPGSAWLRATVGEQAVLRACVVVLAFYVLLLWGEAIRLHGSLTSVLGAFRQFREATEGAPRGEAGKHPKARLEAARLLIAALRSDDPSIRATSRHNLARLVGQDLGADADAWQAWLRQQEANTP